jgi:hypothetical protein
VGDHRVARLHVGGAAAVQHVSLAPARQVVRDRDGVDVPGQQHPTFAAELGPGEHGIAGAQQLQVRRLRPQGILQRVGEGGLVAGDAGDVDERGAQVDRIGGEVEADHTPTLPSHAPPPASREIWARESVDLCARVGPSPAAGARGRCARRGVD